MRGGQQVTYLQNIACIRTAHIDGAGQNVHSVTMACTHAAANKILIARQDFTTDESVVAATFRLFISKTLVSMQLPPGHCINP